MKLHHPLSPRPGRRGAALLLAFLVLIVVIAVAHQIHKLTDTDARVASNDLTISRMDHSIEAALMDMYQMLADDAEAGAGGDDAGLPGMGADPTAGGDPDAAAEGGGEPTDSRMDQWGKPQSRTINEIPMRILVQDEDSKYNVLNMLNPDPDEAGRAFERVVSILDLCREGTLADIDHGDAEEMARFMLEHMLRRDDSFLPRPMLMSDDDEEQRDMGLPLTLREFVVLEPFEANHFRDFRDSDNNRVHSIGSYLTVFTAVKTLGEEAMPEPARGGSPESMQQTAEATTSEGGWAVNINTAPSAVLKSLMDGREVAHRIWDEVVEYRNLAEEEEEEDEEIEPLLDEFGQETYPTRIFDDLEELAELNGWDNLDGVARQSAEQLLTTKSNVFSIYVTARWETGNEAYRQTTFLNLEEKEEYERRGTALMRTVRSVVWRATIEDEVRIIPLIRWEVLDYIPLEVLDYPDSY